MTTIAKGRDLVTLINVFTVEPETQQQMVDLLVEATETVINRLPGFVSANIHKSLDGTRVANYAQWRSREAFEAMLRNAEARLAAGGLRDADAQADHGPAERLEGAAEEDRAQAGKAPLQSPEHRVGSAHALVEVDPVEVEREDASRERLRRGEVGGLHARPLGGEEQPPALERGEAYDERPPAYHVRAGVGTGRGRHSRARRGEAAQETERLTEVERTRGRELARRRGPRR